MPQPPSYTQSREDLTDRYRAVKLTRPTSDVAREMDLSPLTLARFERGHLVTLAALHKVADWVRTHERAQEQGWSR